MKRLSDGLWYEGMSKQDMRIRLELDVEEGLGYPIMQIAEYNRRFGTDRWIRRYVRKNYKQWMGSKWLK